VSTSDDAPQSRAPAATVPVKPGSRSANWRRLARTAT